MKASKRVVFVLTNGCYSDYRIVGVYSTQANADMAAKHFPDDASVEEYEINPAVAEMRAGRTLYFVRLSRSTGDMLECHEETSSYGAFSPSVGEDIHKNLYTRCWGSNKAHAIKIAGDRRRAFLALPETHK